jgi:hypothetical protein
MIKIRHIIKVMRISYALVFADYHNGVRPYCIVEYNLLSLINEIPLFPRNMFLLALLILILPLLHVTQTTEQCPQMPHWTIDGKEVLQDGNITVVGIINSS